MGRTHLQNEVSKITSAIDKALDAGDISKSHRQELYKALFFVLVGDPTLRPELKSFCKKGRPQKALTKLVTSIGKTEKIPQVLHASLTKDVSVRKALDIWKVPVSDLKLVEDIARLADMDLEIQHHLLRRYYSSAELPWLAEVEEELEEVEVFLNNQALEDMLLGVFETYKVPKSKKEPYSEVFGLCLGMSSRQKTTRKGYGTRTKWFVHVDKAVPQIRARANSDSVIPNAKSIEAVVETASALFPQLEIIGDYHSHPYRDFKELKNAKGWEASKADNDDIINMYRSLRKHPKRAHRMRVSFVVAIAKGRASTHGTQERSLPSVFRLSMAGCQVYVSVYRILSNGIMTNKGVTLVRHAGEHYFKAV